MANTVWLSLKFDLSVHEGIVIISSQSQAVELGLFDQLSRSNDQEANLKEIRLRRTNNVRQPRAVLPHPVPGHCQMHSSIMSVLSRSKHHLRGC